MIGAAVCALIVLLWWLLFSRARWYERVGALVLIVAAVAAERSFVHPSIAGGAMGNLSYILAIPTLSVALVGWAAVEPPPRTGRARRRRDRRRPARMPAVGGGRTGGINADGRSDFHLRWTKTPEERLLAQAGEEPLDALGRRGDRRRSSRRAGSRYADATKAPAPGPRRNRPHPSHRSGLRSGPAFADPIATA